MRAAPLSLMWTDGASSSSRDRSHSLPQILSFCSDPGSARDVLGGALLAALEASLPEADEQPERAVALLAASICFATHRLKEAQGASVKGA